jgi:hypothetical protein
VAVEPLERYLGCGVAVEWWERLGL